MLYGTLIEFNLRLGHSLTFSCYFSEVAQYILNPFVYTPATLLRQLKTSSIADLLQFILA